MIETTSLPIAGQATHARQRLCSVERVGSAPAPEASTEVTSSCVDGDYRG